VGIKIQDNSDMPGFQQYPGACGLTSLLMGLKPESRQIDTILNAIWDKMKPLLGTKPDREKSFNWQRVIEWLLFQIPRNETLKTILESGFGNHFNDEMLPYLEYRLEEVHHQKRNDKEIDVFTVNPTLDQRQFPEITKKWLMDRVYVWKMDFELEMLAYLFGCKFVPWEKTEDGTGAIFFNKSEIMRENLVFTEKFTEKINFIMKSLEKGGPVLYCATIHWLAVKAITKIEGSKDTYLVKYNDPASGTEHKRYLDDFSTSERFYLFEFSEQLLHKNEEFLKNL
jgi:hypothetical protein